MKDVAAHVGVSSTLIHYHFKGKESIYEAIWARKAPISVHNRLEAMRLYAEKVGDDITVEGALHAWIDADQIGRASCRERVCQSVYISVVGVSLNNNTKILQQPPLHQQII